MAVALLFSVTVFNGCDDNDQVVEAVPTVQELWNDKTVELTYPTDGITTEDRIKGAIMGALIGDALGVGCHWYYDFEALWAHYGTWIDDYVDPKWNSVEEGIDPGDQDMRNTYPIQKARYDAGVRGGWNSQSGELIQILLEVIADNTAGGTTKGEFVAADYVAAVEDFFKNRLLPAAIFSDDGIIVDHSGRFTDRAIRENFDVWYNNGAMDGDWASEADIAGTQATSEGAQWGVILAALYRDPEELFPKAYELTRIWYRDLDMVSDQVMYIMTVQAIINGVPLEDLNGHLRDTVSKVGAIGKYISSTDEWNTSISMGTDRDRPMIMARMDILTDERFLSLIFGPACGMTSLQRYAYYYSYKYAHDFEKAVLLAINARGNNMARAALTGGLAGAMVGIDGIPQRFIDGLDNDPALIPGSFESQSEYLLDMAQAVANGTKHAKK